MIKNNNSSNETMDNELYDYLLNDEEFYLFDCEQEDVQSDIYWKSLIEDIDGGDNFVDYCEYIFRILEEEGWYE